MTTNFTDDMLREAVVKADIRELEALPADHEIEHEFSKRFERRMTKLVRRSRMGNSARGAVFLRRRLVVLVASIVILLATVMSIPAVPVLLVYEKGSNYISYSQQRLEEVSMDINTEGVELREIILTTQKLVRRLSQEYDDSPFVWEWRDTGSIN